jgi:membrane fusion protein, heavy metal efflux system
VHDRLPSSTSPQPYRLAPALQVTILLAVAGVAALLLFVVPALLGRSAEKPAEATAQAAPGTFRPTDAQWAGLKLITVERMTFRTERITDGKIANNDDATTPVFSPYSGRVTKLFAKAGDHVERGAPLLSLVASEFVQGQNDLLAAIQTLNAARAQLRLTTINEKRQHALLLAKAAAVRDWEQAQTDLQTATSNYTTAEVGLAAVRNRLRILGKSEEEIDVLATARKLTAIEAEAVVTAPIGGTVITRQVGLGQFITSVAGGASAPVFSIGNLATIWLLANVRETDAPLMRVGEAVEVRVLAYPGRIFKAKLAYVAPSVDPNTHRLPVRAEVENSDGALKPEMFARFSIITGDDTAAPAVPEEAVVYEGETARVWVAGEDKSLALRQIRVGRISEGKVEIVAGLEPGEKVVTSGSLFIDRAAKGD